LIFEVLAEFFPVDPELSTFGDSVPGISRPFEGEGLAYDLTAAWSAP
jgi:hypothetical protein